MAGLPKKYAKMGFKKGWAAYKRAHPGKFGRAKSKPKAKAKPKPKRTIRQRVSGVGRTVARKTISVSATGTYMALEFAKPAIDAGAIEAVGDVLRGDFGAAQAKLPAMIESYGQNLPNLVMKGVIVGIGRAIARQMGVRQLGGIGPLKITV